MSKFSQGLIFTIIAFFSAVLGAIIPTYFGSYLQSDMSQRNELASDLADFYSAGADVYYADQNFNSLPSKVDTSSPYYLELEKTFHDDYRDFLTASIKLATQVPPGDLRKKIFDMDNRYSDISGNENIKNEDAWFAQLDMIRDLVLGNTVFEKSLNPLWK
jgi:hypothetical protein